MRETSGSSSGSWVSVSGTVEFVEDSDKVDDLWDAIIDTCFAGKQDPGLGLIKVVGQSARFWGMPGGAPAPVPISG